MSKVILHFLVSFTDHFTFEMKSIIIAVLVNIYVHFRPSNKKKLVLYQINIKDIKNN